MGGVSRLAGDVTVHFVHPAVHPVQLLDVHRLFLAGECREFISGLVKVGEGRGLHSVSLVQFTVSVKEMGDGMVFLQQHPLFAIPPASCFLVGYD